MNRTHQLATGLILLLVLLLPSAAQANTYTVEGCGTVGTGALQFSVNPLGAFNATTSSCNPNDAEPMEELGLDTGQSYVQGATATWGLQAPAGETVVGLAYRGGWYQGQGGWLSGWILNGDMSQNAVPSGDDCLTYVAAGCSVLDSGDFNVPGAGSIEQVVQCDAAAAGGTQCPQGVSGQVIALAVSSDAVVELSDPSDAEPSVSGTLWAAANGQGLSNGWLSGLNEGASLSLGFQATDPGGVCTLTAALTNSNGQIVASSSPVADAPTVDTGSVVAAAYGLAAPFTTTQPCGGTETGTSTFAPDLSTLPTGTYYLNVEAQNPGEYQAGSYSYATGTSLADGLPLQIDNTVPVVTVTPSSSGNDWQAQPQTVTVTATDAAGSSGLANIRCTTPTGVSSFQVSGHQASEVLDVSTPGTDFVSCVATSVAGNESLPGYVSFDEDSQAPTVAFSGASPAPVWDTGDQKVEVSGSEGISASGIASITCELDGGAPTTTAGSTASVNISGDGAHTVSCNATTGAGIQGPTSTETIQIDSQQPTLTLTGGPAAGVWYTTTQHVTALAHALGGDTISSITCKLGSDSLSFPNETGGSTESLSIAVAAPGGLLTCQAHDSAGNSSTPQSWSFLIDDTPPTGYFSAPDSAHPTQVRAVLSDSGSGLAGASIEIDVDGSWKRLATSFNAGTGIATADIPDGGSLPDGTYVLRVRVWDRAGNVGYVSQAVGGGDAVVTVPVRTPTRLTVLVSSGHQREAARASVSSRRLTLSYGESLTVTGRLQRSAGGGVAAAKVTISQLVSGDPRPRVVARCITNRTGEFRCSVAAGPSRTLVISYTGSTQLRGTSVQIGVVVSGKASLELTPHLRAGGRVTLRGRVIGGYLPRGGVLVQLWYASPGTGTGWTPFERAVRTTSTGRWKLSFRVSSRAAGYHYEFKAVVAGQSGWGYTSAVSPVVARTVV